MQSRRHFIMLALLIPIVVGIAVGILVGDMLYERHVEEIERTSGPVTHGDYVLYGYRILTTIVTTLVGLVIGVFLYGFLKNRYSEQIAELRIGGDEPL